jgi:hypothetical protein
MRHSPENTTLRTDGPEPIKRLSVQDAPRLEFTATAGSGDNFRKNNFVEALGVLFALMTTAALQEPFRTMRAKLSPLSRPGAPSGFQALEAPMAQQGYCRTRDLPKLIGLWSKDLADTSRAARKRIVARLENAIRAERRRGRAGHSTYNLVRHSQLLAAHREEWRRLRQQRGG